MPPSAYVTQSRLDSLLDLPISLPETSLQPNDWIIISTLAITSPQSLTLQLLQVNISSVLNQDTGLDSLSSGPSVGGLYPFPGLPTYVTSGLGLAYIGLYQGFDSLTVPSSQAAQESPVLVLNQNSTLPIEAARSTVPAVYTAAGSYSVVLTNNTSNCVLRVSVLGQFRLDLGTS